MNEFSKVMFFCAAYGGFVLGFALAAFLARRKG